MMSVEEMMADLACKRGLEDRWTIWFCQLAENPLAEETAATLWGAYQAALRLE